MNKAASLPVRLDPESKVRLQQAAKTLGLTPSALIRILVCSFVAEFERSGSQIMLPPQWQKLTAAGRRELWEPASSKKNRAGKSP
ncbi:MAG: hypothetical protein AB7V22_07590 [Kiritimatiellia bacterium]